MGEQTLSDTIFRNLDRVMTCISGSTGQKYLLHQNFHMQG